MKIHHTLGAVKSWACCPDDLCGVESRVDELRTHGQKRSAMVGTESALRGASGAVHAQPDNSHPDSVEIFVFLEGSGEAVSDEHSVAVTAGDVLVLPSGSVHHIRNTSSTERLYAVTIMANDRGSQELASTVLGFEALVKGGPVVSFEASDKAVIFRSQA